MPKEIFCCLHSALTCSQFAGMTRAGNIVAFLTLDKTKSDLRLLGVMGGAVLVAMPAFVSVFRYSKPKLAMSGKPFPKPLHELTLRLMCGAILFGVGWGLSGLCPGPAIVGLASFQATCCHVQCRHVNDLVSGALECQPGMRRRMHTAEASFFLIA